VEAPQHAGPRARQVILHERHVEAVLVVDTNIPGFPKVSALVGVHLRLNETNSRE
jgi:hypothetical protein